MKKCFFISIIVCISNISFGQSSNVSEQSYVLNIFKKYISLNLKFLSTVDSGYNQKYITARKRVESFAEDSLSIALQKYATILNEQPDTALISGLCSLIINSDNSANEEPSWHIGKSYLKYPDVVEFILNDYDKHSKKTLVQSIDFGFQNVIYGKPKNSRIDSLDSRINNLKRLIK